MCDLQKSENWDQGLCFQERETGEMLELPV